jgi:outer membrane protein
MNYLYKFIITIFFSLILYNPSYSNDKIAFIDIDYLIKNSEIGKKVLLKINDLDNKNVNSLKKKDTMLKNLETEIRNKKNIISDEAYNKEVISFREKIVELNEEKNNLVKEFNTYKKKELQNIFDQISPIISNYMDKNSITIILDSKNIFMGKVNSDLTKDILTPIGPLNFSLSQPITKSSTDKTEGFRFNLGTTF